MNEIKVIPVTGNIVDMFWGEGWENWERVRLVKNKGEKTVIHLAGKQMPKMMRALLTIGK